MVMTGEGGDRVGVEDCGGTKCDAMRSAAMRLGWVKAEEAWATHTHIQEQQHIHRHTRPQADRWSYVQRGQTLGTSNGGLARLLKGVVP